MAHAVSVLLVDDSVDDRIRFGRALAGAGFDVHDAEDGSEAWRRLQQEDFDVVVSDRQMPNTDGLELTRLVRAHPDMARIPVIIVSANDAPIDREAGFAAGAVEYIGKNQQGALPVLLHSVELLARAIGRGPTNRLFERVLIVDRSSVGRQLLSRSLRAHCRVSTAVGSVDEARGHDDGRLSLVVLDATMDEALPWLEERSASVSKPAFVIVTSQPSQEEETRVSLLGAIGYLSKPFSYRELARVLVSSGEGFSPAPVRAQMRPLADALIADPKSGEPQLLCPVLNLSAGGALLGTAVPFAVGTHLMMWLRLDGHPVPTHARVVRVQEPGWGRVAGCGVAFEFDSASSARLVELFVARHRELRLRPPYV